jgi:hypothetical protein
MGDGCRKRAIVKAGFGHKLSWDSLLAVLSRSTIVQASRVTAGAAGGWLRPRRSGCGGALGELGRRLAHRGQLGPAGR